jgi:NADH-quinone oxidoreductase subunit J
MFTLEKILFFFFSFLVIGSSLLIAYTRNLIYAGFLLFVTLISQAALYVFAGADFPAIAQIIIYVGGILILLLFGVMLSTKEFLRLPQTDLINLLPAGIICILMGAFLFSTVQDIDFSLLSSHRLEPIASPAREIGKMNLTYYLIAFEGCSFLLLIALIGAASIARQDKIEGNYPGR